MVRISVIIPVYNEIKFIQKTLESVIGDADEIILSDNASTDGTSDICQSFADKYPEIKYTRHKENIGAMHNFYFCLNQVSGKYIRNIGAHDMSSIGSNQSMACLLEKHPDVAMVYPKYVIWLKEDYSFLKFHAFEEFGNGALSDSASIRVKSMSNIDDFSIFFGLWRTEEFLDIARPRIFQLFSTDFGILTSSAAKGKFLADERFVFFRMHPRADESYQEVQKRYAQAFSPSVSTTYNMVHFFIFVLIAEVYDIILEEFGENFQFYQEILQNLSKKHGYISSCLKLKPELENMLSIMPIIPEKLEFFRNFINIFFEMKNRKKNAFLQILKTDKKIFLFGSGITSHDAFYFFPNINWSAFIENDSSKIGKSDVLPIISFQEFIENSKNALVFITSSLYGYEMKQQLIDNGFPENSIVVAY